MTADLSHLTRSGNLSFSSNLIYSHDPVAASGRVVRQPTGHLVLYGSHGRRILATDPDGHPLHECEWSIGPNGAMSLVRARLQLDWGQWVGLKPAGLVNSTVLDLSRKPGWQRLRVDDLRRMAAQALRVPLDEVRFFYGDEDLMIDAQGRATIQHKKDAFYLLDDGSFDHARFMACMGAMHWSRIDFLPVVELFQSLLPGTGSAAFELIRGLYDDQNDGQARPLPLRYRGIPTYPSEAAFRLFSAFFIPQAPGGRHPFELFMNPSQSHEVTWLPSNDPPRRYWDSAYRLCVTIKGDTVQKVTLADDPTGLSYGNVQQTRSERGVGVRKGSLILMNGVSVQELPIKPAWGPLREIPGSPPTYPLTWRDLFAGTPPQVSPTEAFGAVLLYPEDDTEIDEAATQPFVADYLQDVVEDSPQLSAMRDQARHMLIDNFDAALQACISPTPTARHTVLYTRLALIQKQAQVLWNTAAQQQRFDTLAGIRLLPDARNRSDAYHERYDWIYIWVPFSSFDNPHDMAKAASDIRHCLAPAGLAFLIGPSSMADVLTRQRLRIVKAEAVETLPTFRMHQTILPHARLRSNLTLFHLMPSTS